jgi:hypothetical protein
VTDIQRLTVSLTKHNAHKVARLLKTYPTDQVFDHLDEISADPPQARANLSIGRDGVVPPVWAKARVLGDDAVDALLLVGIIFSHHDLIRAMREATSRHGPDGHIPRGGVLAGKAYTNFARVLDQLGFATQVEASGVSFSLRGLFQIGGLGPLVGELLALKLLAAGWNGGDGVAAEAARQGFAEVFGVSAAELDRWLMLGPAPASTRSRLTAKDEDFFEDESEGAGAAPFLFRPGHVERQVEPVTRQTSPRTAASQLHNQIQNGLYAHLAGIHGRASVGTEIDTGTGTSIDLVTRVAGTLTFYEIKTGCSIRTNIRQALPQLLEYAYWPAEARAHELVIVSHRELTSSGRRYLKHLRDTFGLPLSYRRFDVVTGVLD